TNPAKVKILSSKGFLLVVKMRHKASRFRLICYLLTLNCILVPLVIRYWSCWHFIENGALSLQQKKFMLQKIPVGGKHVERLHHRKACKRKKNIVFLKTHKTGSSTITNILNRYGEARNLNFVLPNIGSNRLDWPWFFKNTSFYSLNGTEPNILCNHARFNKQPMTDLMPNDTVYVTILRNPISQFESSFSYMTF
uniref:Uncharacterized protein n=1 Tax=Clytia hemisphaerica TaxID=252671 RepID=A0A7M5V5D7_9CNID